MKVILIESQTQDYGGCNHIVGVATSIEKAEALLGKMARVGKIAGYEFKFLEVEADEDFHGPWEGNVGHEIKEQMDPASTEA